MKTYEFTINEVLVETSMKIEAESYDEAIAKAYERIDRVAIELGVDVRYSLDCENGDDEYE